MRYDWTIISRSLATCSALVRAAQTWFDMQGTVQHIVRPLVMSNTAPHWRLSAALAPRLYLFSRTAAQMRDGPARPQALVARARYALQHVMHLLELRCIAQSCLIALESRKRALPRAPL